MNAMRTDDVTEVTRLLAAAPLCLDPQYRGEVARLMDSKSRRSRFLRRDGMTVDQFGELLWSRGITSRRLDCREVLDLLDSALTVAPRRLACKVTRGAVSEMDAEAERLRHAKMRKVVCPECGAIQRGTRKSAGLSAEHRNSTVVCYGCTAIRLEAAGIPLSLLVTYQRAEDLPEEILAGTATATAVPF